MSPPYNKNKHAGRRAYFYYGLAELISPVASRE